MSRGIEVHSAFDRHPLELAGRGCLPRLHLLRLSLTQTWVRLGRLPTRYLPEGEWFRVLWCGGWWEGVQFAGLDWVLAVQSGWLPSPRDEIHHRNCPSEVDGSVLHSQNVCWRKGGKPECVGAGVLCR